MSILEILATHQLYWRNDDTHYYCECGKWKDDTCAQEENHRAHVAMVLEQHEREAKAQALEAAADGLDRGIPLHETTSNWIRDRAAQLKAGE